MTTRVRSRLHLLLLALLCCWALSSSGQQTTSPDDKALSSLLEQHFAAYNTAMMQLDLPTMKKLTTPDLTAYTNKRENKPLEDIAQLLADPVKNKVAIAARKAAAAVPRTYKATSVTFHEADATSEILCQYMRTMKNPQSHLIQMMIGQTFHAEWQKVAGEWKLHRVVFVGYIPTQQVDLSAPEWARTFTKAAGIVGKSKADLVAAFGEPSEATSFGYDYKQPISIQMLDHTMATLDRNLRFEIRGNFVDEIFFRFRDTTLTSNESVQQLPTAKQVWSSLDVQAPLPESFEINLGQLKSTLLSSGVRLPFPLQLWGKLKNGMAFVVTGSTSVLPLIGTSVFNVNTNQREITELKPNPDFHWQNVTVYFLSTDARATHHQPGPYGTDYPIAEKH